MATVIGPNDGKAGFLGSIGVRFMIDGEEAGGDFSLVEHPMPPRALAAPLHRHNREDEYSYVIEGRMGALLGDEVAGRRARRPGLQAPQPVAHVLERRRRAGRILEIIAPAGFEHFFKELVDMGGVAQADPRSWRRSTAATGSTCSPRASPSCSSASTCAWASRRDGAAIGPLAGIAGRRGPVLAAATLPG